MKIVQLAFDEELIATVDKVARELGTSRSAFVRQTLRSAVASSRVKALERQHREGYRRKPVKKGEFDLWEREQVWGER